MLTEFAEQDGRKALPKHTKECKMLTVVGAVMVLAEYTLEGCASSVREGHAAETAVGLRG